MARMNRKTLSVLVLCGLVLSLLVLIRLTYADSLGQLIYKKNSLYHRIFVYRRGQVVSLQFGKRRPWLNQSQVDLSNLRLHRLEYTRMAFCGLLYHPEPDRMLVLGLGGGVIPREMHHYFPELEVDVVEIDGDIPPIAERFFSFQQSDKLRVNIADGRVFVKKQLRLDPVPRYDLVVLDAFNSDYIPFHLTTREFLQEVKGVLAEDGVVVANVFSSNRLFDAELKTFLAVFGRCQVFFGVRSSNAMLVAPGPEAATLTSRQAAERARLLQQKHRFAFDLLEVARMLRPNTRPERRARVLTDHRAPVNWLRNQEVKRLPETSGESPGE